MLSLQSTALLGSDELDVRVVELGLDHVARPRLAGDDVPGGEVLDVLVAGEGPDLAGRSRTDCSLSMALCHSSSVKSLGSAPSTLSMKPIVSRISVSSEILPLRSSRVSSSSKLFDLAGHVGVVGDAGQAALPRRVVARGPGPTAGRCSGSMRLLVHVGDLRVVELLDPAEVDHPGRHPVGEHEHVALDRLAGAELVLHLGEELGVVVDVVGVVDADAGGLRRRLDERRGLLAPGVDVGRPVGDDQPLVAGRDVLADAGRRACTLAPSTPKNGSLSAATLSPTNATAPPPLSTPRRVSPRPSGGARPSPVRRQPTSPARPPRDPPHSADRCT